MAHEPVVYVQFEVGMKVEAQVEGHPFWFPGTVGAVNKPTVSGTANADGGSTGVTYAVYFDDGTRMNTKLQLL